MQAAAIVVRSALRRQAVALAGVALIVALGTGVTFAAFVAAHRTDHAQADYVRSAEVSDLVINPDLATRAIDRALRRLPGVAAVQSDNLFVGSVTETKPGRFRDLADDPDVMLQVRGSTDGHYIAGDRPVVTEGRFAAGPDEVFVTDDERAVLEKQRGHRIHVGDVLEVAFWWSLMEDAGLPPDTVVSPVGVERLRVAGFGKLSDEVLPDELYVRQRLIVSADIARKYTCEGDLRADMTEDEATGALFPERCSRTHRIYSLQLQPRVSTTDIQRAFAAVGDRLAHDIPPSLAERGAGYAYRATDFETVNAAVRQVTRPTVASLLVFGGVTGAATIAVAGLAIWRVLRRNDAQQRTLSAIGATRGQRMRFSASPTLIAVLVGTGVAIPIAVVASVVGPVGSVRAVDPSPGYSLPGAVFPVVGAIALVLVLITWVLARSGARRSTVADERRRRPSWVTGRLARSGRPSVTQGVGAALSARGSDGGGVVLAGSVVVIAAIVAAVVFGTSLATLVARPEAYGWPWDAAVITNGGYRSTDPAKVAARLDHDAAVEDYALFAFDPATPMAGHPVPVVFGFPGAERTKFALVDGREPERSGEAILGAATARELHAAIGDRLPITTTFATMRSVKVVGIGLIPAVGLFLAERAGLGTGAVVMIDADPTKPDPDYPAGMTAISLRKGTDAAAFVDRLRSSPTWDSTGIAPYASLTAVRPPGIVNADSMRTGPLVLAIALAVGLVIGLALSIGVSVRDRRRELAILRSLGFTRRDVRVTVGCQALATMAVGVIVGVPLGVIAGRLAWRAFAEQLGVAPSSDIPYGWLGVVAIVAVVLGLLAALLPARAAARIRPSVVLGEAG